MCQINFYIKILINLLTNSIISFDTENNPLSIKGLIQRWQGEGVTGNSSDLQLKIKKKTQTTYLQIMKLISPHPPKKRILYAPLTLNVDLDLVMTFDLCSSGIEDNPTIFYQLIRGSTDQTNKGLPVNKNISIKKS